MVVKKTIGKCVGGREEKDDDKCLSRGGGGGIKTEGRKINKIKT
jgi:hypothetical protein